MTDLHNSVDGGRGHIGRTLTLRHKPLGITKQGSGSVYRLPGETIACSHVTDVVLLVHQLADLINGKLRHGAELLSSVGCRLFGHVPSKGVRALCNRGWAMSAGSGVAFNAWLEHDSVYHHHLYALSALITPSLR